ncbi:MAG: PspA/IM30 family protein [Polaromonas sp.]|uniref:PspA/IM30 family protein n=1 Tax=Polaromonas sp. TaxID=1869339 RepID=UPI003266D2D9
MADSLRTRVARVIAGGAHALLDKIEDAAPVAVLEQSVREVEQVTDEVRAELGRIVANRHLAQQQHLHLNSEHDALSASIATALAENREDLAKPAISRQLDIEAQLPVLEASLGEMSQQDKELSGFVDALMGKKREMEKAIQDFEASRRLADSAGPRKNVTSSAGARVNSAQSAFDRTFQRQTGLSSSSSRAGIDQTAKINELNQLVRDNKISERLAALKAGTAH